MLLYFMVTIGTSNGLLPDGNFNFQLVLDSITLTMIKWLAELIL